MRENCEPILSDDAPIVTWAMLLCLGFGRKHARTADLVFHFGSLKLSASRVMSTRFDDVVLFTGALATEREVSEVDFEMPLHIQSFEQGMAWIVWHLDRAAPEGEFIPKHDVDWVAEGRQNKHLLPWVIEMAAYEARPHCIVRRDWLRVAIKTMKETLTGTENETLITFAYSGGVLTIRYVGKVVALPAEGSDWPNVYSIPAEQLRRLPNRLMREFSEVAVWKGRLHFASCVFDGVIENTE